MQARTWIASIAIAAAFVAGMPSGVADDDEIDPIAEMLCSQLPEEVRDVFHTIPWPTPEYPDMVMTTHAACYSDIVPLDTDCTATNYSLTGWKWNSPYNAKLDTTNPYGFSATTLLNFWNAGGNTWDNAVAKILAMAKVPRR